MDTQPRQDYGLPLLSMHVLLRLSLACVLMTLSPPQSQADAYEDAIALYLSGDYQKSLIICEDQLAEADSFKEKWYLLGIDAAMATGAYQKAQVILEDGLEDRRVSGIKLYPAGHRVALFNQQDQAAKDYLEKSVPYINSVRYSNVAADSLVYLGRAALKLEVDPRVVLEVFYDPGMKATPPLREAFLAAADLALEKEDYAVAESTTQQGLIHFPEDADLLYRWARALAGSGNDQMGPTLNRALESNPHHVPSMLMLVDHSIDAEQNDQAIEVLDRILEVNPNQPEAWAYKAIMAHLDGNSELETTCRERALKHYQKNPEIDHLIGKKLSQKYRFKEGATYQEAALALEQAFRPAQLQLSQDLLRLGDEAQGWALADDIHNKDGYNITAYNLVQLKEVIDGFKSMENDDFILRMDAAEAAIFGNQVMDLLMEAKQTLQEKYEVELDHPITVEMFPNQSDFGVRTFGMPHNPGFLGVCFGDVITANSPSSAIAHSSNWKAVLWHEFCHVITLNMTHNKMPRWLSEGISVFEELERDPSWGQHMNADYRQRILRGSMTPIDELSGAFLNANTDQDMQFAYYQSSLVVAFIVEQHGHEALRQTLHELGLGTPINQALATHTKALDLLDAEFRQWASQRAKDLAPTLNWDEPDPDIVRGQAIETLLKATPNNYYHLMSAAREFAAKQDWAKVVEITDTLIEAYPEHRGLDGSLYLGSRAHAALGHLDREWELLKALCQIDGDIPDAYQRLMELAASRQDWDSVATAARKFLAVNPLTPKPYQSLAIALEALQEIEGAIDARQTLIKLNPLDPAKAHYDLARLLKSTSPEASRKHTLLALEEAPRYQEAQKLLLDLVGKGAQGLSAPNQQKSSPLPQQDSTIEPEA